MPAKGHKDEAPKWGTLPHSDALGEPLLTPGEVARRLSVARGTVYSWVSRGLDIPFLKIHGALRFRRSSIESWLQTKEFERKRRDFEL